MEFNQEVKKATDSIYQKISKVMPEIEWSVHAPYIHKINKLKSNFKPLRYKNFKETIFTFKSLIFIKIFILIFDQSKRVIITN